MFKRILVPLDGTERSRAILPQVRMMCRHQEDSEVLLQIALGFRAPPDGFLASQAPQLWREAKDHLAPHVDRLERAGLQARALVSENRAAKAILKAASQECVSLIAMTTRGRTGIVRIFLGSVTDHVLRRSPVPVLVQHQQSAKKPATPSQMDQILFPIGEDGLTECALPYVLDIARSFGSQVTLLHAVSPRFPGERARPRINAEMVSARDALVESGIPFQLRICEGRPSSVIRKTCREVDANLIVMPTHARTGLSRWLQGSMTEKVIRYSTVPVLAVPRRVGSGKPMSSATRTKERIQHVG